jgi:hypothetical protein
MQIPIGFIHAVSVCTPLAYPAIVSCFTLSSGYSLMNLPQLQDCDLEMLELRNKRDLYEDQEVASRFFIHRCVSLYELCAVIKMSSIHCLVQMLQTISLCI